MSELRKAAEQALKTLQSLRYRSIGPDVPDEAIEALRAALVEPSVKDCLTVRPPNVEGETQCIVRWMAETPHGWVGSYDKAALECLGVKP